MRVAAPLALGSALLVSAMPAIARAQEKETESADAMRYPPSSVRPKLIAGGLTVTGLAYGAALLSATTAPDLPGIEHMKIPIAGPWISLAKTECPKDDPDCGFFLYLRGILTVADGLMQLGGLGIMGEGLFMTTEASAPAEDKPQGIVVRPAPIITGTTTGIGIVGRF